MPAQNTAAAVAEFGDLLYRLADEADADVSIDDAAEAGWLVPEGRSLLVRDGETGREFLVSISEVAS